MPEHSFIAHLKADHQKQKELGSKMVSASSPAERDRLRKEFFAALYPHMRGEEASFFEQLKSDRISSIRIDAMEGMEEHHAARLVLRELMEMSTEGDEFTAKAKVVDEMNRHHIKEEEGDIFQHMKKRYTRKQLNELFRIYEAREEEAMGDYPEHTP